MCKCTNCSNCVRDETTLTSQNTGTVESKDEYIDKPKTETIDKTIEISYLKLPEALYDAICVLNGRYGTGSERKQLLGSKYEKVQAIVNQIAYLYE